MRVVLRIPRGERLHLSISQKSHISTYFQVGFFSHFLFTPRLRYIHGLFFGAYRYQWYISQPPAKPALKKSTKRARGGLS
jgi:hypothetical protein